MENNFFRVSNLYEASFLMAKGFSIAGKEQEGRKTVILFSDKPKIRQESMNYYNGGSIKAKDYSDSYRTIKDFIFDKC